MLKEILYSSLSPSYLPFHSYLWKVSEFRNHIQLLRGGWPYLFRMASGVQTHIKGGKEYCRSKSQKWIYSETHKYPAYRNESVVGGVTADKSGKADPDHACFHITLTPTFGVSTSYSTLRGSCSGYSPH